MKTKSLSQIITENGLRQPPELSGTDKDSLHSYIDEVYDPIFRTCPKIDSVLEIGVWGGSSLVLWKLACPNSTVIGIDPRKSELHPLSKRMFELGEISIFYEDAYNEVFIGKLNKTFDLIVDDGPHDLNSQIASLQYLQHLKPNGVLVIEDISTQSNLENLAQEIPRIWDGAVFAFSMEHLKGRFDDRVIVITKNKKLIEFFSLQVEKFGGFSR